MLEALGSAKRREIEGLLARARASVPTRRPLPLPRRSCESSSSRSCRRACIRRQARPVRSREALPLVPRRRGPPSGDDPVSRSSPGGRDEADHRHLPGSARRGRRRRGPSRDRASIEAAAAAARPRTVDPADVSDDGPSVPSAPFRREPDLAAATRDAAVEEALTRGTRPGRAGPGEGPATGIRGGARSRPSRGRAQRRVGRPGDRGAASRPSTRCSRRCPPSSRVASRAPKDDMVALCHAAVCRIRASGSPPARPSWRLSARRSAPRGAARTCTPPPRRHWRSPAPARSRAAPVRRADRRVARPGARGACAG